MKRDPGHRKLMKTRDAFVENDSFDPDKALTAAIKMRKFLLERVLQDRQHFPDNANNDNEDVNNSIPYGSRNELHYY